MSFKPLFNPEELQTKYRKQDGFVVLIRDNAIYNQGNLECFYKTNTLSNKPNFIGFDDIKTDDRLYKFASEEEMVQNISNGICIEKFRFKHQKESNISPGVIFKKILFHLNAGRRVGFANNTSGLKYIVTKKNNNEILLTLPTKLHYTYPSVHGYMANIEYYKVFDDELDFYKWLLTESPQP